VAAPHRWDGARRALGHRPFRRFFAGQAVSVVGSWVQTVAMAWLMYRLTGSTAMLGLVTFLSQGPLLVVGPLAGWLGDRVERRRLVLVTQSLLGIQAGVLGLVTLAGLATPVVLLVMAGLQGVLAGLDTPVRQSFLADLAPDRAAVPSVVALNSFVMNCGRLAGPMLAGLLLARLDEGACFLVNALSYLAVVVAVMLARGEVAAPASRAAATAGWRAALRAARKAPALREAMPLVVTTSLCASPYATLMPAVVRETYGGGPGTLGLLVGCAGAGGVLATAWLALGAQGFALRRVTPVACAAAGLGLLGVALAPPLAVAAACMVLTGAGIIATAASANMRIQSEAPEPFRSRWVSLYVMGFLGMAPLGGLVAGILASALGVLAVIGGGGAVCCMAAALLRRRAAA
jgi:MFS family permease